MEICKICGKEYTNLGVHVRQAHKLGIEEYREKYPDVKEEVDDENDFPTEEDTTEKVILKEKAEKEEVEDISGETLKDFLEAHDMSKKELIAVIENFKEGKNIPVKMTERRDKQIGEAGAEVLKDQQSARTTNLHVAETLVKNYGFKVKEVTTRGHTIPKTWILEKV